jgi:outer membrane protein OmpA-like peptidoglycan-associated protein
MRNSRKSSFLNGLLVLVLLLCAVSLHACHTVRVSMPASSTEPTPIAAVTTERVVIVRGRVLSTQDSTTEIPGVELIVQKPFADSTGQRLRTVTELDGSYQMELKIGHTYQVTLNKDGRKVGEKQYLVPEVPINSSGIQNYFYADYKMERTDEFDKLPPMIFFDTNQATLRPESKTRLDYIAALLKNHSGFGISIEGHAEPREVPRNQPNRIHYQVRLGQRRAQAAYDYLAQKGVSVTQRITTSYGGERPAAPNDNAENRQLNRRVELQSISVGEIASKRKSAEYGPAGNAKPKLRFSGQKHSLNTRSEKKAPAER